MFYPAERSRLQAMVGGFLSDAHTTGSVPKAIIAPHAGYIYSGPVAASAYALLAPARESITRVVLLGPAHRAPLRGLALPSADRLATPLGEVPVDKDAIARIADLPPVQVMDQAHSEEHSLEVHLPFLQTVLDHFSLVPLAVGKAEPEEVGEVLERLWDGPETTTILRDAWTVRPRAPSSSCDRRTSVTSRRVAAYLLMGCSMWRASAG
jgi:AmmeMemoRadiSam system protein B